MSASEAELEPIPDVKVDAPKPEEKPRLKVAPDPDPKSDPSASAKPDVGVEAKAEAPLEPNDAAASKAQAAPEPEEVRPRTFEARLLASGKSGRAALSAVASTAREGVKRTAEEVASSRQAEDAAWKDVEAHADLPELSRNETSLTDLALRLDREADFHRTLAVRALRPGPGRLLALASGGVALVGGTMLALAAGVRAFFGAGIGETPGSEAVALALMLGVSAAVGSFIEAEQRSRAQAALRRAELAERRLERIAAIMALAVHDPKRFTEALTRLEREPTRG